MSSLFESFLGNAAGAGANIIGDRMKADEDERKIKLQDELLMKRQMAIEALREEQPSVVNNAALRTDPLSGTKSAMKRSQTNHASARG